MGRRELSAKDVECAYRIFEMECGIEDKPTTLKGARTAQQKSMRVVAARLGISAPTYCELEKNSAKGAISVQNLRSVADALDCELIVTFKLKNGRGFVRNIWEQLLPFAIEHPAVGTGPNRVPGRRFASIVLEDCFPHPEIRRKLGWARKNYTEWARNLRWCKVGWPFNL